MRRFRVVALLLPVACHSSGTFSLPAPKQADIEARFRAAYGYPAQVGPIVIEGVLTLSIDSSGARSSPADPATTNPAFRSIAQWLWQELDCWKGVRKINVGIVYEATLSGSWGIGAQFLTEELGGLSACRDSVA